MFCADKVKGGLWFRVVTLSVSNHSHQIPNEIVYGLQLYPYVVWERCYLGARIAERNRV